MGSRVCQEQSNGALDHSMTEPDATAPSNSFSSLGTHSVLQSSGNWVGDPLANGQRATPQQTVDVNANVDSEAAQGEPCSVIRGVVASIGSETLVPEELAKVSKGSDTLEISVKDSELVVLLSEAEAETCAGEKREAFLSAAEAEKGCMRISRRTCD